MRFRRLVVVVGSNYIPSLTRFYNNRLPEPISGPSSSSHARHSSRSKIRNGMPSDLQNPRPLLSKRDDSPPPALDGGRFGLHSYSRDVTPPRTPDNFLTRVDSKASLVVNYLPSKFSSGVFADSNQGYYRRGRNLTDSWGSLKTGDGADTSRNDEADLAEDSSTYQWLHETNKKSKRKLRWNKFKWFLFFANLSVSSNLVSSNSDNLNMKIVDCVFSRWSRILPSYMVQYLSTRRYFARRESDRAHHLHARLLSWNIHLCHRLGRNSLEQPFLPCRIHISPLDCFYLYPYSRIYDLQTPNIQPRGEDQCTVVAGSRAHRKATHTKRTWLLWILFPLC